MSRFHIEVIMIDKCEGGSCGFRYNDECRHDSKTQGKKIKTKDGRFPSWCPLYKKITRKTVASCANCGLKYKTENELRCTLTKDALDMLAIALTGGFHRRCPLGLLMVERGK